MFGAGDMEGGGVHGFTNSDTDRTVTISDTHSNHNRKILIIIIIKDCVKKCRF